MAKELPSTYVPGGLNLKVPVTVRNVRDCIGGKNFDILDTGHLSKRKGFVQKAGNEAYNFNCYGLSTYDQYISQITLDAAAGFGAGAFGLTPFGDPPVLGTTEIVNRLVSLGPVPYIWGTSAILIGCTSGNEDLVSIYTDTDGSVKFKITDSITGAVNFSYNLGTGNEVSPVLASALVSSIDAESSYTASLVDASLDFPAAFLNRAFESVLTTAGIRFLGGKWCDMNPSLSPLWPEMASHYLDSQFSNGCIASMNGVLYAVNGFDPMIKYDGRATYHAGMTYPNTPTSTVTATAGDAGMSGVYKYQAQYVSVDARRQEVIGGISDPSIAVNNTGPFVIDVDVSSLASTLGYDARGGIFDTGHSATDQGSNVWRLKLKSYPVPTVVAGDVIIFFDTVTETYLEKVVVAITDVTTHYNLDISSDAVVTVVDDTPCSANLRTRLYRTVAGGSSYKYLTDIANDMRGTDVTFADSTTDVNLGATFADPIKYPMVPPKAKYLVSWQNNLVLAGDPNAPYNVYYSEYDGTNLVPENFPDENTITIGAQRSKSEITGLAVSEDSLIVFTRQSIVVVTGNLASDTLTVSGISTEIGCVSHHTIVNVGKDIIFLSEKGIYKLSPGSFRGFELSQLSANLDPFFKKGYNLYNSQIPSTATAIFWPNRNVYILFISTRTQDGEVSFSSVANTNCLVLKLDTLEWVEWDSISGVGGATIFSERGDGDNEPSTSKESLWLQSREAHSTSGLVKGILVRESDTDSEVDFCDHSTSISMEYKPQWEFASAPSGLKLYTQLAIDAFRTSANLPYLPTGTLALDIYRDFDGETIEVSTTIDYQSLDNRLVMPIPLSNRRAITVNFRNSEHNKNILISGWAWDRLRYRPDIRR